MTTTAGVNLSGATSPTPGPRPTALPGSLAASLAAGTHPTTLLFPGIDGAWPRALASALLGRPELSAWVDAVVAELDRWAHTPEVRALGLFSDGFSTLVHASEDAPVSPVASTGPFNLVGNLLTNLAWLQSLEAEGLAPACAVPSTRAAGHSAGLLAAWVAATERGADRLVPVEVAADAARIAAVMGVHAARHPWSVSDSVITAALASDETARTPMVAISGPRSARLRGILDAAADRTGGQVVIGVTNSPTRHVLSGSPEALSLLREGLAALAQAEADRRAKGRHGGSPFRFAWEPLPSSVPFHHPDLADAAAAALEQIEELGLALPARSCMPVIDPATCTALEGDDVLLAVVTSILSSPHDWVGAVTAAVPTGAVAVFVSPLGSLAGVSASILRGRGALVVDPSTTAGRTALFTPGSAPAIPSTYERFAPRVVRAEDGSLRLANRHTQLTGRSPMVLPGMTPSTAEAPIVVAAANGGHVAELAGGGQVNERIFAERVRELGETLEPGQEVVLNAMYLDPYLWGLHVGRERLVLKARAAGAPFNGVTISAGIPDKPEALAILDELVEAGLWLNAFKPGTVAQVTEVLSIAADTPHTLWIHLEGGAAGGHHSWEDLDELLLATYHKVREHENVVLAVGGGIGEPERAAALLTGTWAHAYGAPTMPVDALLLGTVTMATHEAAASDSVKQALAVAQGHSGWVGRGQVAGGTTSGRSSLDADIYFLDNSASRAARLLDAVAGDAAAVAQRKDEIVTALAATAKPYFGDVADMTYAELLGRFVELTALGRHGRYEDGAWLDPTHRSRYVALLQRAEARLDAADSGEIPTLFATSASVDDPAAALDALVQAHPAAATALLHPADVAHFLSVCRQPGKPIPFVPVIDADVRRWYQSDSLWQSHSDLYDADQVLIIPGPTAVAGITTVDEPVAHLLDRFETAVAESIGAPAEDPADVASFRLGLGPATPAAGPEALLGAALAARTWLWLGAARSNPLHRIGAADEWTVIGEAATWSAGGDEAAVLSVQGDRTLALTITWPDLGLAGDGSLVLPVAVATHAGDHHVLGDRGGPGGCRVRAAGDVRRRHRRAQGSGCAGRRACLDRRRGGPAARPGHVPHVAPGVRRPVRGGPGLGDLRPRPPAPRDHHDRRRGRRDGPDPGPGPDRRRPGRHGRVLVGERRSHRPLLRPSRRRRPGAAHGRCGAGPRRCRGHTRPHAGHAHRHGSDPPGDVRDRQRRRQPDPPQRRPGPDGRPPRADRARHVDLRGGHARRHRDRHRGQPERLRQWTVDFVAPVLPGQEVTFTVRRTGVRDGARILTVEAATADGVVALGTAVVAPPRTMYVFPGQGIQSQGMGMDGYARSAAARGIWDRADSITTEKMGFSILEVVRDNPTEIDAVGTTYKHPAGVLHLTQFTQVAMATLASAQVAELREAGVFDPDAAVAGHSVGEYNALAASSTVLPLEAVIELVFARGQGMHGLVPRDAEGNSDYRLGRDPPTPGEAVARPGRGAGQLGRRGHGRALRDRQPQPARQAVRRRGHGARPGGAGRSAGPGPARPAADAQRPGDRRAVPLDGPAPRRRRLPLAPAGQAAHPDRPRRADRALRAEPVPGRVPPGP